MTRIAALVALLSLGLIASAPAQAQPVTLRFSSFEPPVAFITKEVLTPWAERVAKDSNGTLKIEMYPGGTLGRDPAGQIKLVQDGVADIAWIVPSYTPGRFDDTQVVELPFLVRNPLEGSVAAWRMVERGVWSGFDEIRPLGVFTTPPNQVHGTFPIKGPGDIQGKKFRAAGPTQLAMLKSMGAVPVGGITGANLAESLSRGLVEGTLNEWNALSSFRALEIVRHHAAVPMGSVVLMVAMNKARYDGLPAEAKAAIDRHSGEAFSRVFGEALTARSQVVMGETAKNAKHTLVNLSGDDLKRWEEAARPSIEAWANETPRRAKLLEAYTAELTKLRASN
jgi:TRAP-type C4-dicarboxylate transport system substrate-binding protein